jgi:hypothetical protein
VASYGITKAQRQQSRVEVHGNAENDAVARCWPEAFESFAPCLSGTPTVRNYNQRRQEGQSSKTSFLTIAVLVARQQWQPTHQI